MTGEGAKIQQANFESSPDRSKHVWADFYRGAVGALGVQIAGALLGLVSHVILARLLGTTGYGTYTLVLTWVGVLSVPALMGQTTSVVRFVPNYVIRSSWGELRGLRIGSASLVFAGSLFVSAIGAVIVSVFARTLGGDLEWTFFAGFALLIPLAQLQLNGALHQGLKRPASAGAFNLALRPILLLLLVIMLFGYLRHQISAPLAMLASAGGATGSLVVSEVILSMAWPSGGRDVAPRFNFREWLLVGQKLLLVDAIAITLNRVDVLLLGGLGGSSIVGPYYAAVQMAAVGVYGLNAVNTIVAPTIAERYAAGDKEGLSDLTEKAAWATLAVSAGAALFMAAFGKWLLSQFGPGFDQAYVPLLIILGGQCLNAATGPAGFLLTMTRFELTAGLVFGVSAFLNIGLCLILIPRWGAVGAAVATAFSMLLRNILALTVVWKRLRINPTILSRYTKTQASGLEW